MREVSFHYGALADPLEKQANAQGFTLGEDAEELQSLSEAVTLCYVFDVVTDSQHDMMIKKLNKMVVKRLKEQKEKDCNNCANATDDFNNEIDVGCYMCCKGLENNYVPAR